jgi:hypothetical protein
MALIATLIAALMLAVPTNHGQRKLSHCIFMHNILHQRKAILAQIARM